MFPLSTSLPWLAWDHGRGGCLPTCCAIWDPPPTWTDSQRCLPPRLLHGFNGIHNHHTALNFKEEPVKSGRQGVQLLSIVPILWMDEILPSPY